MILDIITTPFGFGYPDLGGQGGPPAEGDPIGSEPVAPTDDGQGGVPDLFYEYEDPSDKKKYSFPDKDSLTKHITGRGMTQATFTRKSQEHANNVKAFEGERLKFENDRKSFHSQYDEARKTIERAAQIDKFFAANPKAYEQIQALINPQDGIKSEITQMFEEKYGSKLSELEKKLSEKELLEQLSGFDNELKEEFEDYDPDAVGELFAELSKEGASAKDLKRMLYYAHKGKSDPVEMQARMAEAAEKKKRAGLVSGSGKAPEGPPPTSFEAVKRKHKD